MSDEQYPPSLTEFLTTARTEFACLLQYGFEEVEIPNTNPFSVAFERDNWRVVVEGLSYGSSVALTLSSPDGRQADLCHLVPDSFRKTHREGLGRGQLGGIKYLSLCLRIVGQHFLDRDLGFFEKLHTAKERDLQAQRIKREYKERDRAAHKANESFRSGAYSEVIRLLSPHESLLSPAQRLKLDLAKKRQTEDRSKTTWKLWIRVSR